MHDRTVHGGNSSRSTSAVAATGGAEGGRLLAIHHVQLPMRRGAHDEARRFFVEALGLEEIPKPEVLALNGGLWFRQGGVSLHLGEDLAPPKPSPKAHLAMIVDGLAERCATLRACGFEPEPDSSLPGLERCYVTDPFGNRIELIEARTAEVLLQAAGRSTERG